MQVMPDELLAQGIASNQWLDPPTNILAGAVILAQRSGGGWEAAAAYYFGIGCDYYGTCTYGYAVAVFGWANAYAALLGDPFWYDVSRIPDVPDSPTPTAPPTPEGTPDEASATPTPEPTGTPTDVPNGNPTTVPTDEPTEEPTAPPTTPTEVPTKNLPKHRPTFPPTFPHPNPIRPTTRRPATPGRQPAEIGSVVVGIRPYLTPNCRRRPRAEGVICHPSLVGTRCRRLTADG